MASRVPFIGRNNEFDLIDSLVEQRGTQCILCVGGPGGIGKTRFLQEVHQRYSTKIDNSLWVTKVFDFDDYAIQDVEGLRWKIMQNLTDRSFEPYILSLQELRRMEQADVSFRGLLHQANLVDQSFLECINQQQAEQRIVFLFDTTDSLGNTEFRDYFLNLISHLDNCLSILAGKNAGELSSILKEEYRRDPSFLALPPLLEGATYLDSKLGLMHIALEPQHKDLLLFLAQGRPILIDLAVEWISRADENPIALLLKYSLDQLELLSKEKLEDIFRDFEKHLIRYVTKIRSPMDRLLLIISRTYPLDTKMIAELLGLPQNEAKALFDEANDSTLMKSYHPDFISLHDDVRSMIDQYVWPEIDPDQERRKRDSLGAALCLMGRLKDVKDSITKQRQESEVLGEGPLTIYSNTIARRGALERERWVLETQRLEHILFRDFQDGVQVFLDLYDEATNAYYVRIREALINRVLRYTNSNITTNQGYEINIRLIETYLYSAKYTLAQEILPAILTDPSLSPSQKFNLIILQGRTKIGLGQIEGGINDFTAAHVIAEELSEPSFLLSSNRWLGEGYLKLGHYQTAATYLKTAEGQCQSPSNDVDRGWILNNLAYVYGRLEYANLANLALDTAKEAERLWKKIPYERGLGALYVIYMSLYKRRREFDKSIDYGDKAWNIFEPQNDIEWLCRISYEKGVAYLEKEAQEPVRARQLFDDAKSFAVMQYMPEILYWLAQSCIATEDLGLAERYSTEGLELAIDSNPSYWPFLLSQQARLADINGRVGLLDNLETQYYDFEGRYPEIQQESARGLFFYFMGNLALQSYIQKRHDRSAERATNYYLRALPDIAQHIVYGDFQLRSVLEQLDKKLSMDQQTDDWVEFRRQLGRELKTRWQSILLGEDQNATSLDKQYPEALLYFERWGF